ncbi:MAG: DUF547 domain-containing protein [Saprospiraceae bacterium]
MTKLKFFSVIILLIFVQSLTFGQKKYADLSQKLIEAARYDKPYKGLLKELAEVDPDILAAELDTDEAKKAFWINVYNAHIQFFLKENPKQYEDRGKFFHAESMLIAGKKLSFDKIEHGIIRRSKNKYSLGFFGKIRVDKFEKKFRVKKVDGRVHFALNCGAESCPAVASYDYTKMDEQLDKSSKIHLKNTSKYNVLEDEVLVTKLLSWFRADFGKKKKVIKMLKKYEIIPEDAKPSIKYDDYDWTMDLDNYIDL